ncbi:hypothetical protein CHS0354_024392 [Potamilus streckersoni]|uniref:C2H2-type domain-containing protein n=1 Tax=Potamilus streckersoni TaxID=2493646 RepID=A0AAE0SW90_9BIVA|nr:hypothetical protein CHS0354_024392 [Potamilus streckersoni]
MDPSYFSTSLCVDNMDHEQHEKLVPSESTGSLCIARFQPLNPGSKTPTYIHNKNSDDDDDDLDESESNEDEMEKDESDDEISDSSSYKNLSSNTDVSSTNSNSRSFHLERIAADNNIIEDKYGPNQGFKSKKTAKQQHCSEIHGKEFNKNNAFKLHFQVSNEQPYVCYICNRSFTQREHLEFHIDNHTKIKLYCEICGQKFKKAQQLSKHLHIHSGEKTYKCQWCSQGFIESSGLYSHLRSHYIIRPFSCAACKKTFARRQNLKGHLIKAHNLSDEIVTSMLPQKRKAYEHFKKTSRKMSSDKIHNIFMPKHLDSQTSSTKDKATDPCIDAFGHCGKSNSRHMVVNSAADSLQAYNAGQTGPPSVEINTLLFDEINDLQGENNGDHKTITISKCHTPINGGTESQTGSSSEHYESRICQNNTNSDGFSKAQTNSSENQRKFQVECADDNVQNSDFSKNSDPYVEELINAKNCSIGKDTDNNYYSNIAEFDLESGISLPEQPPYPCSYCEQQFSRRSNLKAHIKIHLGVKPFPCPTCKKNFNRKSNLKVHMAKVHNYDKNAIMECLKTYYIYSKNNTLGDTSQNNATELNGMDTMDAAMPVLIKDLADNEGQEKHLAADNQGQSCHNTSRSFLADKSTDNLNDNNHLLFSAVPGCNFSVPSFEPYSDINQTNENMYLHNSDHYLPLYPTEDNATYNINSTSDTFKENIFLSANNDANMPPYDAQNMFQNELSSELNMSLIKDEQMDKEFGLNFHSQMPSEVRENQSEITSDLKDSFTDDSVSKTYECKICGHKFSRRGNLMGHYKVHSGIRQFVCPLCQKSFTRKSNLRVHLVKIHNMTEEVSAHLSELGKQQETGADMQENDVLSANSFYSYFD